MKKSIISAAKSKSIIDRVEVTSETLTGRGGLSLFVRYLRNVGIYPQLETFFRSLRRSRKGQPVTEIFKQLFCFFLDGTSRHLVHFDALARDPGYAGAIETAPESMLSSHAVKRFFGSGIARGGDPGRRACAVARQAGGQHGHGQQRGSGAPRGASDLQGRQRIPALADDLEGLCDRCGVPPGRCPL
ncbi:MAG: hypothetical protein JRJ16_13015 [Deltaproteobacteria bacterium]|nr:hypothetical protein [Deltaproteobacteria bacterium]